LSAQARNHAVDDHADSLEGLASRGHTHQTAGVGSRPGAAHDHRVARDKLLVMVVAQVGEASQKRLADLLVCLGIHRLRLPVDGGSMYS
jgi:hypothetical protein